MLANNSCIVERCNWIYILFASVLDAHFCVWDELLLAAHIRRRVALLQLKVVTDEKYFLLISGYERGRGFLYRWSHVAGQTLKNTCTRR